MQRKGYIVMPFHMVHLHIAKNIYSLLSGKITDLPRYYLGNLAPDAVHTRMDYNPGYKKTSHLCVGDVRWGMASNNDEWTENVLKFLHDNINSPDHDFIVGYCCHILSDIYNNITVWMPFRLKYPDEFEKGYGGLYHRESDKIDIELGLRNENSDDFWRHLEKSEPFDFRDLVSAEDMKKHRDNILYKRYSGKEHPDLSSNRLITLESTMKFTEDASIFIAGKIKDII